VGNDLIESWNKAGWIDLPLRIGDKIARLVGADPGELVATDSTSVNLFKVLTAALAIAQADAPERRVILSERGNFRPTCTSPRPWLADAAASWCWSTSPPRSTGSWPVAASRC